MLWFLGFLSIVVTFFWWFERKLLFGLICIFMKKAFLRRKNTFSFASAMGLLRCGWFGAFGPASFTKESLDEAIRKKQLLIWNKLNLHSFDALLEVDGENCLFSLTFSHRQQILCDCIIENDEFTLQRTAKLIKLFPEYRNVRLHTYCKWKKSNLSSYYDAIVISSSFCSTLSHWELQEFLQFVWRSARINCQIYIEVFAASNWSERLVNYVRFSLNGRLSWFLSIKFFIHALNAAGFEVLQVENSSIDALETAKSFLHNLQTAAEKNNELEKELSLRISALEDLSLCAWSILATKSEW
jgi:hypothetical protein